jgi:uncharacterized membrane protein YeaQ/YmgE (transglycosylase-associated protein family)
MPQLSSVCHRTPPVFANNAGAEALVAGQPSGHIRKAVGPSCCLPEQTLSAGVLLLNAQQEAVVNVIACIVVGILAGWIAERITGRNHGLLTNLIVGIVGAFVGGFLVSSLLGFQYAEGLNLPSVLVATIGAVLLLGIFGGFRSRRAT